MAIENLNIPQAEVIEDHPDEDVSVFKDTKRVK